MFWWLMRRASSRSRIRWRRLVRLVRCCCWAIRSSCRRCRRVCTRTRWMFRHWAGCLMGRRRWTLVLAISWASRGVWIRRCASGFRGCRMMARWRARRRRLVAPCRVLRRVWCRIRWSMRVVRCVLCRRRRRWWIACASYWVVSGFRRLVLSRARWRRRIALWWRRITRRLIVCVRR